MKQIQEKKKTWKIDLKKYPDIDQAQTVKNEQYMKNVSRIKDLLTDKQDEINEQLKQIVYNELVRVGEPITATDLLNGCQVIQIARFVTSIL